MSRLVTLYNGSGPQHYTFHESPYADEFGEILHQRKLETLDPATVDALVVPSRMHLSTLGEHANKLEEVLESGGDLVLFGKRPEPVLDPLTFEARPTNFWWWLASDGDSGLRFPRPGHPFFEHVPPEDCEWHFHGVFDPPPGADVLVEAAGGGAILYLDEATYPGTLLATSLDPIYHFGSRFMPATDRFLSGFLPWLHDRLDAGKEPPPPSAVADS